ncbi:glycosyltransferase family 4 protein [Bacillus sp. XF8]|uniref:glycosyltransferase family 4 protein n=1 Tax=Bacillus sp. XF8 TaxID=2819289 RepID=UPI001AA05E4B|nr:glycosyltransferase family 4 protein [Bacillus sp. XF8]MBO1579765.1 glycosyltransferase family 4 protein [Bacillus sp. XF8]
MSSKKDIIMIGPSPFNRGGISSVIQSLLELDSISNRAFLVSSYTEGNKFQKVLAFLRGIVQCLFILIFNRQVKIMHIHTASRGSFFRKRIFVKMGKWFGKKIILHMHGAEFMIFYQESNENTRNKIQKTLETVDVIITLSQKWKSDIDTITNNSNVMVIYNAINSSKFNLSELNELNILFMGRVGTRKGIYDLVDIMPEISKEYPNVKLHIAGDGDLVTLNKKIEEFNLNKNTQIHGWIDYNQKMKLLEESSIFILPSYNEGLPVSILEAMAAGLPVISTNIGGIPEQIINGLNGFIIKPGDKKCLLTHIKYLLQDNNIRQEFGKEARHKVEESFSLNVIGKEISSVYESLI